MESLHCPTRCTRIALSLILSALLSPAGLTQDVSAPAQSPSATPSQATQPHRPRIGLALSGGGALGLAEIGVIQWMEENHIPVDRVAGTSMGSIIAAMYATGMSPAEMRRSEERRVGKEC